MGYLKRLIEKLLEPADDGGVEQRLKNDFGERIRFSSYRKINGNFQPDTVFGTKQAEYPDAWAGADAAQYVRADGSKALRFTLDIPTFDSGDRESDSWHTLYLMPGKKRGSVDGIYCTGGYRLACAVYCTTLKEAPEGIWRLLRENGVLPSGGQRKHRHRPGEKFCAAVSGQKARLWFTVDESGGFVSVDRADGEIKGVLALPETVDGFPVACIGASAFWNQKELVRVKIPGTVRSIKERAFFGCCSLQEVALEEGLRSIGGDAFYNCERLERIALPEGLEEISYRAFSGCRCLTVVRLPKCLGTSNSGRYSEVFSGCTSLERIETADGCAAFRTDDGVLFSADGKRLLQYPAGKKEQVYTVPEGVEYIENEAFSENAYLHRAELPEGLCAIGKRAFGDCTHLEEVDLRGKQLRLGGEAFEDCGALRRVHISAGVYALGADDLAGCINLEEISVDPENPYFMEDGGVLFSRDAKTLIAFPPKSNAKVYQIPEGVTCIGKEAFAGCKGLVRIDFPKSLETIGERAFLECLSLRELELPEGVKTMEEGAFLECKGLIRAGLPGSLKKISWHGFAGCSSLQEITLAEGLRYIGAFAFSGCSSLERLMLPGTIRYIEEAAFHECSSLRLLQYQGTEEQWQKNVDADDDMLACCPVRVTCRDRI